MGYSPEVVAKVREEFENKRQKAVFLSQAHSTEVYEKCPSIRELDRALALTGLSVFKASLEGKDGLEDRIKKIKKDNFEYRTAKRGMLKRLGYPENYTDIIYECDKCQDTGYVGVNMCTCMRKALLREAYNSSGLGKQLEFQTFKNFNLDYYSNEPGEDGISIRDKMASILEKSKQYVANFGKTEKDQNLLFAGNTGLGKTHITTAIAKGVIDRGFDVVYDSAQNIMRSFEQQRFENDVSASNDVGRYFDCDLLVIDDLGTEFKNSFTQSVFYNLVNTRINSGKAMIVSTNLESMSDLLNNYDQRTTSRLIGAFKFFKFEGEDIRILKIKMAAKSGKER